MKVTIDITKSVHENASFYYDMAKRSRRKIQGAKDAYEKTLKKLDNVKVEKKTTKKVVAKKREWYQKFRWFFTSKQKLVIGGRDATSNDIIVKKHLEKGDLVFHTQMPGSPFVVIKAYGQKITKEEIDEAAMFCAANSKAWNQGFRTSEVFYVKPDQLKKEFGLPKGSFMVYGQRIFLKPEIKIACGLLDDHRMICGPITAVQENCKKFVKITQGKVKKSDTAKKLRHEFVEADLELDNIMQALPPGECEIKK